MTDSIGLMLRSIATAMRLEARGRPLLRDARLAAGSSGWGRNKRPHAGHRASLS